MIAVSCIVSRCLTAAMTPCHALRRSLRRSDDALHLEDLLADEHERVRVA